MERAESNLTDHKYDQTVAILCVTSKCFWTNCMNTPGIRRHSFSFITSKLHLIASNRYLKPNYFEQTFTANYFNKKQTRFST